MYKLYISYLNKAIANDRFLDHFFREHASNSESKISPNIPKYNARLNAYNQFGKYYLLVDRFLNRFWIVFVVILFLKECIILFSSSVNYSIKKTKGKHLFFINSPISARLAESYIEQFKIERELCIFLLNKKKLKKYLNADSVTFTRSSSLSLIDAINICLLSFISLFKVKRELVFYAFHFIEWYSLLKCLSKIKYDFFHSFDHYDRYAILADAQSDINKKDENYFFHQHGKFPNIDDNFILPYKLKNVSYAILSDNSLSYQFLVKNIVDANISLKRVEVLTTELKITKIDMNHKYVILVIGNVVCLTFHQLLINQLVKYSDIFVYYKPHPSRLVYIKEEINSQNIKVVDFYPDVDLVVSYKSTLLDSYILKGYSYLVHNLDESNVDFFMKNVKMKLRIP